MMKAALYPAGAHRGTVDALHPGVGELSRARHGFAGKPCPVCDPSEYATHGATHRSHVRDDATHATTPGETAACVSNGRP